MITVSELAKDLNMSTQAIYKKINKSMKNELTPYIKEIDGQKFIDDKGITIIKNGLQPVDNQGKVVANLNTDNEKSDSKIVATSLQPVDNQTDLEFYKKQLELLQDELKTEREHSRQQADRIADLAEKLAELTRNSQVLLKQEQDKNAYYLPEQSPEENNSSTGERQAKIKKRPAWQFWKK